MSPLEDDLRTALAREEPSGDFAERVLQALPSKSATLVLLPPRRQHARTWMAAAAAVVIGSATLWFVYVGPRNETEIVGGVTNVSVPGPRQPIFEGGVDRPSIKTDEQPLVVPENPEQRNVRPPRVRRVTKNAPQQTLADTRENDAQAYLAARQLRLALTITNEKLRVAQRSVTNRSEYPIG